MVYYLAKYCCQRCFLLNKKLDCLNHCLSCLFWVKKCCQCIDTNEMQFAIGRQGLIWRWFPWGWFWYEFSTINLSTCNFYGFKSRSHDNELFFCLKVSLVQIIIIVLSSLHHCKKINTWLPPDSVSFTMNI